MTADHGLAGHATTDRTDPDRSVPPFTGRRAIVTGGSHGIGAATVARLRALGATVAVLDVERGDDTTALVEVDLSVPDAVVKAAAQAVDVLGGIDILVSVAGLSLPSAVVDLDLAAYHRTLAVNLHAPVLLMRELGRHLQRQRYGRIVNVTSVHAAVSEAGSVAYDASKAGLEAATRTAALELAAHGVLVNAVAPGFVATRMSVVDGQDELEGEEFQEVYVRRARLPLQRAAAPAEIAETITWLASESNTYVTGQVLTVDGGLTARF